MACLPLFLDPERRKRHDGSAPQETSAPPPRWAEVEIEFSPNLWRSLPSFLPSKSSEPPPPGEGIGAIRIFLLFPGFLPSEPLRPFFSQQVGNQVDFHWRLLEVRDLRSDRF